MQPWPNFIIYAHSRFVVATAQVVAGMNYFLTLKVERDTTVCEVHEVQVYDRFGDMRVMSRDVSPCN